MQPELRSCTPCCGRVQFSGTTNLVSILSNCKRVTRVESCCGSAPGDILVLISRDHGVLKVSRSLPQQDPIPTPIKGIKGHWEIRTLAEAGMIALRSGKNKISHEHYVDAIAEVQAKKKEVSLVSSRSPLTDSKLTTWPDGQLLRIICLEDVGGGSYCNASGERQGIELAGIDDEVSVTSFDFMSTSTIYWHFALHSGFCVCSRCSHEKSMPWW